MGVKPVEQRKAEFFAAMKRINQLGTLLPKPASLDAAERPRAILTIGANYLTFQGADRLCFEKKFKPFKADARTLTPRI
jgi:hypothetical protein